MSTVSPIQGPNGGSGAGHTYSQSHQSHHSSAPSHHHVHSHHSSSQDGGGASGLPHTSFDSIASHHGHQQSSQAAPQQSLPPPQQPHGSHAATNGSQWSPAQSAHYGSSGAGAYSSQHGVYNPSGYYSSPSGAHGNSTSSFGGGSGYSAYSVQPHQNYSMYGNHAMQGGAANAASAGANGSAHHGGSAHHSGNSTPTSTTPYAHPHHSSGGMLPGQGYPQHHYQSGGGYYGSSGVHNGAQASNGMMSSSPSYTSAPQYSTQLPLAGRHRVTTTLWEDEGTLCFQVDARGVCVARRHDNNMINGTKLLNVCGMSRGKRDGILKNEKERIVVKVGAMHLKGVWITFHRGKQLAEQNDILDVLYPLFETNIQSFLYHPDNYPRTAAVIAAAQERHAQRSRVSVGTQSPTGYPAPQRSSSHTGPISNPQQNPPPLMRSNTTPSGQLLSAGAPQPGYHHSNGYSSAPNHSQQHSPYAQSHSVSSTREMPHSDSRAGQAVAGDGELAHDAYTSASPKLSASYKPAPLHSSHLLNSTYAFPATGGGPVKYQQRSTLSDRDEASMEKATESISQAYPSWGNRGNAFQTQ